MTKAAILAAITFLLGLAIGLAIGRPIGQRDVYTSMIVRKHDRFKEPYTYFGTCLYEDPYAYCASEK